MNSWTAITVLCLAFVLVVPGAHVQAAEDMSMVAQAQGNSDVVLIRVGLAEPNGFAAWGLSVAHEPETPAVEQATSFGVWGQLSTDITLLSPGTLGLWAGLVARPLLDIDVLYDFDHDRIAVWPGAGVRIAPTRTLSFVARAVYPLGDDELPTPLPYQEIVGLFGLEITF